VFGLVRFLENIFALGLIVELAGSRVESNRNLFTGLVACAGNGFENNLNGFLIGFAAWREAAFVADGSIVASLFQG